MSYTVFRKSNNYHPQDFTLERKYDPTKLSKIQELQMNNPNLDLSQKYHTKILVQPKNSEVLSIICQEVPVFDSKSVSGIFDRSKPGQYQPNSIFEQELDLNNPVIIEKQNTQPGRNLVRYIPDMGL